MRLAAPLFLAEPGTTELVAYLDGTIASLTSTATTGEPPDDVEEQLARAALVLAQLETIQRSHLPPDPTSTGISEEATVEAMLAAQDADAVADVIAHTRSARVALDPLIGRPAVLNPTFPWSKRVGGADADLIVDGCLLELKTSADTGLTGEVARQLIGYLLLDNDDEHRIDELGVLYARRPQLLRWPAVDFLSACADRPVNVTKLRAELDAILPAIGPDPPARTDHLLD